MVVERDGGVATVRLNRPDAMNSLDVATKEALLAALTEVAEDPTVRCVVLTGSGRAFCVGQDLREHVGLLQSDDPSLWETVPKHYNPIVELLATMNKPVVAAINGVAAGAGAAFAMAADFRVHGRHGRLQPRLRRHRPVVRLGILVVRCSGIVGPGQGQGAAAAPPHRARRRVPRAGPGHQGRGGARSSRRPCASSPTTLAAGPTLAYGSIRRAVAFSAGHGLSDSLAQEGELHGPDRGQRRPPRRRRRVPRQGEAGLHRRVSRSTAHGQGGVDAHGV